MKVAVLGGGIAGAAACYRLAREAVQISWIAAPRGATLLTSGALDVASYQETHYQETQHAEFTGLSNILLPAQPAALSADAISFCETLGLHRVGPRAAAVVTARGMLRYPRAADACVLNLNGLDSSGLVGLPEVPFWGWDASWMARSLNESPSAFRGRFSAQSWSGPQPSEWFRSSHDCAAWFESQREGIAAGLRRDAARLGVVGWLLPSACFSSVGQWQAFEDAVGLPVGETLSEIDGLAGARFETAREALAEKLGISRSVATVTALSLESGCVVLSGQKRRAQAATNDGKPLAAALSKESAPLDAVTFDAALLALGGITGGGLRLDRGGQLQLGCAVTPSGTLGLTLAGRPFSVSAEQGLDVSAVGLQKLKQLGVSLSGAGGQPPRLAIAGDFLADRPRTLGAAIESGLLAAEQLVNLFKGH